MIPAQDETFYDLCGATGYYVSSFITLFYPQIKASIQEGRLVDFPSLSSLALRQVLVTAAVGLWATRLGVYTTSVCIAICVVTELALIN
jgi:hypothetical protein